MMTLYELVYIIPATFTDEDVGRIEQTVKALLEKHGATIESTVRLGKFRFAYPIKHVRHGHYMMVRMNVEGASVKAIDEALRISSDVLRYIILRADEAGGEKFDLVQFAEVDLNTKESADDRPRRRRDDKPAERKDDIKSGVAILEGKGEEAVEGAPAAVKEMTAEELEKKIDTALQEKA